MKLFAYSCAIALILLCLVPFGASTPALAQSSDGLSLDPINLGLPSGHTLMTWYESQSGNHGAPAFFGAYVTLPVGNHLYLGLGSNLPAQDSGDGAYFAVYNGANLMGIAEPNEQGLHEMIYDGTYIHIAGTDPHPDDHSAGNHYIYLPGGSLIKYRDSVNGLKNVYHTWGLYKTGTTLYAAVGAHDGSDPVKCNYAVTCMGQIYASQNNGASWVKKSDLGGYRVYDITGFNNNLYAISNDAQFAPLSLFKSQDGGLTWQPVAGLQENLRRVHLLIFNDCLIAVSEDRSALYSISADDQLTVYPLPLNYLAGITYTDTDPSYSDYHILTVAKGHLYLIAEKSATGEIAIMRTADLTHWQEIAATDQRLISLSYWAYKDWLITATPGSEGKLWRVDLYGIPTAITLSSLRSPHSSPAWFTAVLILLAFLSVYTNRRSLENK